MNKYEVVSPLGEPVVRERRIGRYLDTLNGKTVCEIWNEEFRGHITLPIVREMLRKRYPDVNVIPYTEFPTSTLNRQTAAEMPKILEAMRVAFLEKRCDVVITAEGG
jgi:hypothetical protein